MKKNILRIIKKWIDYNEKLIENKEYDEISTEYWKMKAGAEV